MFHSPPACDTVRPIDMNLWKLRSASLKENRRLRTCGWTTQKPWIGTNQGNGGDLWDGSWKLLACGPGADRARETGGAFRPCGPINCGSKRSEAIESRVTGLLSHKFHIGNVNVSSMAGTLPNNSHENRISCATVSRKLKCGDRGHFQSPIGQVKITISHIYTS